MNIQYIYINEMIPHETVFPAPQEVLCVIGCNEDERVRPQPLIVTVRSRAKRQHFQYESLENHISCSLPARQRVLDTTS